MQFAKEVYKHIDEVKLECFVNQKQTYIHIFLYCYLNPNKYSLLLFYFANEEAGIMFGYCNVKENANASAVLDSNHSIRPCIISQS